MTFILALVAIGFAFYEPLVSYVTVGVIFVYYTFVLGGVTTFFQPKAIPEGLSADAKAFYCKHHFYYTSWGLAPRLGQSYLNLSWATLFISIVLSVRIEWWAFIPGIFCFLLINKFGRDMRVPQTLDQSTIVLHEEIANVLGWTPVVQKMNGVRKYQNIPISQLLSPESKELLAEHAKSRRNESEGKVRF